MKEFLKLKLSILTFIILFTFLGGIHIAAQSTSKIYLYGEQHAVEKILNKEIEIWGEYYNNQNFRHLFIELSYFTAEFLNLWMNSDGDEILIRVYDDWKGTAYHNPAVMDFYKEIKTRFPETVFHGTDVGHQYHTTGMRYLDYLRQQNKMNSEKYHYTKEAIEQGKFYYSRKQGAYRETMMVANFVREFNSLEDESIMGIYGSAHTGINSMDRSNSVPSMATQLYKIYNDQLSTNNLAGLAKEIDPLRMDSIHIKGSIYEALYFGKQDLSKTKTYKYREYWRLEGAYDDFKEATKTGDILPYSNFPMKIETAQVFVIDYKLTDGTFVRKYYRSDGKSWKNRPTTEEFILE